MTILPPIPPAPIRLIRQERPFGPGDESIILQAMIHAGERWEDGIIGWCWQDDTRLPELYFLPDPGEARYHCIRRAPHNTTPVRRPNTSGLKGLERSRRLMHGMHYYLDRLEDTVKSGLGVQGLPWGHGYILRPNSFLVLRIPTKDQPEAGIIMFRPAVSGHEMLEEIAAIEADFPDRFTIEIP